MIRWMLRRALSCIERLEPHGEVVVDLLESHDLVGGQVQLAGTVDEKADRCTRRWRKRHAFGRFRWPIVVAASGEHEDGDGRETARAKHARFGPRVAAVVAP